jgi:hypothetical protein
MKELLVELEAIISESFPLLVVAPPRTASTALARILFNHSQISAYCHEPCDKFCHDNADCTSIIEELHNNPSLVKEMTFQMGAKDIYPIFLRSSHKPIIFQVRNPLFAVESRIRMVLQGLKQGSRLSVKQKKCIIEAIEENDYSDEVSAKILNEKVFPLRFLGWKDLQVQVDYCKKEQIPYLINDAQNMRTKPRIIVRRICKRLGFEFEEPMVAWDEANNFNVGGLVEQNFWYDKVVNSKRILPPESKEVRIKHFPKRFHPELKAALKIYDEMRNDLHYIN